MTAPTRSAPPIARTDLDVWSTTATLVVRDPKVLGPATAELRRVLARIDETCSRFRSDSEISRILARPGRPVTLSPLLNSVMAQTLRVAAATGYLVDPTVAAAVIAAGYDRDIAAVLGRTPPAGPSDVGIGPGGPAPGARRLDHDPAVGRLTVPPGVGIDLGATAKAIAADEAATRIADRYGVGVVVGIGGDIAVAGPAPAGGWRITVADDHRAKSVDHQTVSITSGGVATSSTVVRNWPTATGRRHHIIDPRTGRNPDSRWRTASVAAGTCLDANAAATAAIVLGDEAASWLAGQGLPALLVGDDGSVSVVGGWPEPAVLR